MPASRPGRRIALATTLTGLLAAPLAVLTTAAPAHAANVNIQILATNDFHGRLQLRGPENRDADAGAAVLAGAVKQLEAGQPNTVFAAAGDLIGASTFESFIQQDKPTIDALNEAGLDVSAAGNHEFDQGVDDLVNRVMAPESADNPYGGAAWQYIASNVRNVADDAHTIPDRWIEDFGTVQVGFVGAVTEDLPALVSPAGIASIKVTNIVREVNRSANVLEDEGADVIVLLVHEGAPDTSYASATSNTNAFGRIVNGVNPNIDAIVSGHTHLAYNHSVPVPAWEGRAVTERPVVSAGQYGQNLNQLLFTVNDATGQVTAKTQNLIALTKDADGPTGPALFQPEFPADPATTTIVSEAFAAAEGPGSVVLGQLAAPFKRATLANGTTENRGGESTLSNLVAEVQRWATAAPESGGAQIALMNAGGLRQNMLGNNAGGYPANLTYKQAAVVQPFANTLVNMRLTGAQLKAVLEQQWQRDAGGAVPTRPFQRLGTSAGFRYTYDPARPEGDRITGMWLNGTALDKATAYSVTVNSFLASGGDNFRALRDGTSRRDTGKVDLQAMVDYLAAKSPVSPDYTQHAVGVSFPAGAPAGYLPGERVKFNLSSLAFTAPEDAKDPSVTVSLGGTNLGTFPVDNTLGTDQFDEYGKAAIDVAIPAGATAGARELVVTGTTTGTVVTVPVTVRAVAVPPTPPTTGLVETRIGRVVHKPQRVVAGETRARIKFRVKATSGTPDGRVRVRVNGKVYKVRLEDGRVKIKLTKFAKPGRYKVTIKYLGTDVFESAKKVVTLRVRRS